MTDTPITTVELAAIKARADAATPGPGSLSDATYAAFSRRDVPRLVAEVERLRGMLETVSETQQATYREIMDYTDCGTCRSYLSKTSVNGDDWPTHHVAPMCIYHQISAYLAAVGERDATPEA